MVILDKIQICLRGGSNELKLVINDGLKFLIGKNHEITLPVIGKASLTCMDIGELDLQLEPDLLHFKLTSSVKLETVENILIPSFYGKIQFASVIGLKRADILILEIKELALEWVDGPYHIKTNKVPTLLRKITKLLTKGNLLVDFLNKRISDFTLKDLIILPQQFLSQSEFLPVEPLSLHSLHLEVVDVILGADIFEMKMETDIQLGLTMPELNSGSYTMRLYSPNTGISQSRISFGENAVNRILDWSLRKKPEFFSGYLNSLRVAFKDNAVQVDILPTHLDTWIFFGLEMTYNREAKHWTLKKVEMSPDENAGFCLRTVLGWITGRIETVIENHFPLTENDVLKGIMKLLNEINSDRDRFFEVSIQNFSLRGGGFLEDIFQVEFEAQIDLALRSFMGER